MSNIYINESSVVSSALEADFSKDQTGRPVCIITAKDLRVCAHREGRQLGPEQMTLHSALVSWPKTILFYFRCFLYLNIK